MGRLLSSFPKKLLADGLKVYFLIFVVNAQISSSLSEEFPFMAALGWFDKSGVLEFSAGGLLISPKYVLAAAHSVYKNGQLPDAVYIGGEPLSSKTIDLESISQYSIDKVAIHPGYDPEQGSNDIAIVELSSPNWSAPICLWADSTLPSDDVTSLGYGFKEFAGMGSQKLSKVNLTVFKSDFCEPFLKHERKFKMGISNAYLCAGDKNGIKDTCQGDTGGPLFIRHKHQMFAVGLTSSGQACSGYPPAIYTRISPYVKWMTNVLSEQRANIRMCDLVEPKRFPIKPTLKAQIHSSGRGRGTIGGGYPSLPGEFPFMAALGWLEESGNVTFNAGGMVISPKFILTAAHCIYKDGKLPDAVYIGGETLPSESIDLRNPQYWIENVTIHPDYDPKQGYDDIALIELSYETPYPPICLWTDPKLPSDEVIATGYGLTEFAGMGSKQLLKVNLTVFTSEFCEPFFKRQRKFKMGISDALICAGDKDGIKDTCQGDSGGPLIVKHNNKMFAVGITSSGQACSGFPPAIYTQIYTYLEWITKVMRDQGPFLSKCDRPKQSSL